MSINESAVAIPLLVSPQVLNYATSFSLNPLNSFVVIGHPSSYNIQSQVETPRRILSALSDINNNNALIILDDPFSKAPADLNNENCVLEQAASSYNSNIVTTEPSKRLKSQNSNVDPCKQQINKLVNVSQKNNIVRHQANEVLVSDEEVSIIGYKQKNAVNVSEDAVGHILSETDFQKFDMFNHTFGNSVLNNVMTVVESPSNIPENASDVANSIRPGRSLLRSNISNTSVAGKGVGPFNYYPCFFPNQSTLQSGPLFVGPNDINPASVYNHDSFTKNVSGTVMPNSRLPIHSLNYDSMSSHVIPAVPNLLLNNVVSSVHLRKIDPSLHSSTADAAQSSEHVDAVPESGIKITKNLDSEESSTKFKNYKVQCGNNSDSENPLCLSDKITGDLELLRKYFVGNKCLICGFVSKRLRGGYYHMIVHLTVKPHQCQKCPKSFATEERLIQHNICHTEEDGLSKFACTTCGKSFKRRSYLKLHQDRHAKVVKYKCEICQRGFTRMMALRRHALTHTGEKPFVCDVCGATFASSSSCKKHANVHTKEIVYNCEVCDKVFYSSDYFTVHMRAHGKGNVFQCDVCNAKFNFKSNLSQHKLTHSEDRSHECHECGKMFKFPHHLRQHLDTHKSDGTSSKRRKRAQRPKEIKRDSNDEDGDVPNEEYVVPYLEDIKDFPEIHQSLQ